MSRSPERMSSYRRQFEVILASPSMYQVRVSSPSPIRRGNRHRSASITKSAGTMGRRTNSSKSRMSSANLEALCYGMSMGLGPKLDLDAAAAENQAFMQTRSSERKEMVALNDRLAVYIEKVRTLESHNKLLEAEIEALKSRYARPSGLRQLYETQLKDLNIESEQIRVQRSIALAAKEAMLGQLEMLKTKYNDAVEARKKTEQEIEALRPDVDRATSGRITLEKQLENLELELMFLQRVHKEEIEELMQQIYTTVSKVELTFGLPDLSTALRDIQSQYDSIAAKNLQEMDAWYGTKFQDLTNASNKHVHSVRSVREEIANFKKDILSKERELESLKTKNEFLEAQIRDMSQRYKKKEEDLQERIDSVNVDLRVTKEKIALLLRDYQDLLNVKMSLEIEITTYRKLIEGEDSRLSSMVHNLSINGKLPLTASSTAAKCAPPASAPPASAPPQSAPDRGSSEKPAVSVIEKRHVEVSSSDTQTDLLDQATELSERKTVLIRTVKTDEDIIESDSQERTILTFGAADDTDEE